MPDLAALKELAERVEGATEDDASALFVAVLDALVPEDFTSSYIGLTRLRVLKFTNICAYHDAAITLMQAVLPGWKMSLIDGLPEGSAAIVAPHSTFDLSNRFGGTAATPALALLLATLRAKIADMEDAE